VYTQNNAPTDMYWNQRVTPAALFGLSPGAPSKAAGAALPPTSHAGGDHAMVPWSPDSPMFWVAGFALLTVLGVTGASVRVRAFGKHAGAELGDS
jgi:hypothetical protein